jgi:hypothetical protein
MNATLYIPTYTPLGGGSSGCFGKERGLIAQDWRPIVATNHGDGGTVI